MAEKKRMSKIVFLHGTSVAQQDNIQSVLKEERRTHP
jgi:hypothetical protein